MNTRIQVEHPVTEMVTGIDLVKSQILIAAGARMADIIPRWTDRPSRPRHRVPHQRRASGEIHAISREDQNFQLREGSGIRVDTAAYAEGVIPPYYDSLIAKLISHGKDRDEAISRMRRALEMFIVEGIHTTIPLHQRILADPDFQAGRFDTKYHGAVPGASTGGAHASYAGLSVNQL